MLTRDSLFVILYSLPVYQLLFYTVQLITFRRTNPSRVYLGMMLLVMTVFLSINAIYHLGYESEMKWLYYIFVPSLLIIPPVFYLYIRSLAMEDHGVDSRMRFLLFLPPLVILFLNFIIYRALMLSGKMVLLESGFVISSTADRSVQGAILLHWSGMAGFLLIQMALAVTSINRVLRKEVEIMRKQPRHLAYLQIRWIIIISLCVMVFLLAGSMMNLFGPARQIIPTLVFNILMLLCGGLVGYFGMKQDTLFVQVSKVRSSPTEGAAAESSPEDELKEETKVLPTAVIDGDEVKFVLEKLEKLMRGEKPYLNQKFSMNDLCEKLGMSRRKVTYVINEVLDKNFYGVINDYRIEEAIQLLGDKKTRDYTMDAIAEMVGFRSKSSFYACFKKYTGYTPTEYRMNNKQ